MTKITFNAPFVIEFLEQALYNAKLLQREMVLLTHSINEDKGQFTAQLIYSFGPNMMIFKVNKINFYIVVNDLIVNSHLISEALDINYDHWIGKELYDERKLNQQLSSALAMLSTIVVNNNKNYDMIIDYVKQCEMYQQQCN